MATIIYYNIPQITKSELLSAKWLALSKSEFLWIDKLIYQEGCNELFVYSPKEGATIAKFTNSVLSYLDSDNNIRFFVTQRGPKELLINAWRILVYHPV